MSKIYVSPNAYLERSETFFCRGFCRGFQTAICRREVRHERKLTWGRRVPEAADKIAFYRVKVFLFELF